MARDLITPVLLAGGTGTRLWPVSRDAMPKQFLSLVGDRSTYQMALARVANPDLFTSPIVVTSDDFRFFARQQADELRMVPTIVLEPMGRDSGPALAATAVIAENRNPGGILLALAADHVILDTELFHAACITGCEAAAAKSIVIFGIRPLEPKTSYGYIRQGTAIGPDSVYSVAAFLEKPDSPAATRYLAEGYLWNSGNLLFRADVLIEELKRFEPALMETIEAAVEKASTDFGFIRLDAEAFARAPRRSIHYAVMEKTERAAVVEGRFRWSDIGSWDAIFEIAVRDTAGNSTRGPVVTLNTKNCLVHTEGRLTALVGVRDLHVVTTSDAVLVMPREQAEHVKQLVSALKEAGRDEVTNHRRVYRPWGHYESVDAGERFQVKRIVVAPGGMLSLQRHYHRAEHWVVVRGTAEVTIGDAKRILHENESIYVPIGSVHRLANPGKIALELVEVQTGSYLGEDDIVRFDDVYMRG